MIENIWSGWRSAYLSDLDPDSRTSQAASNEQSVFSRILESGASDQDAHIVHRGVRVFAIMNAHPYSVGHILVLPYRQVGELGDLDEEERTELWKVVEEATRVLRQVVEPDGFNVGLNLGAAAGGSVRGHIHVHVVPRWFGDANFLVTTAATKAIPEALDVTSKKIREVWKGTQGRPS